MTWVYSFKVFNYILLSVLIGSIIVLFCCNQNAPNDRMRAIFLLDPRNSTNSYDASVNKTIVARLVDRLLWSSKRIDKTKRFSESTDSEQDHLSRIIDDPEVACRHYDLPTFEPDMMKYIVDHDPLECWDESPVYVKGGVIHVKNKPDSNIRCNFTGRSLINLKKMYNNNNKAILFITLFRNFRSVSSE